MKDDEEIKAISDTRMKAHPDTGVYYGDPDTMQSRGAAGELAFERAFGIPMDRTSRPEGDRCVDFVVRVSGRRLTIDVKTARLAYNLLIKEEDIGRCADILVLCSHANGLPQFVGWEHKSVMSLMPVIAIKNGDRNYFRSRDELRPMGQLCNLLSMREP